MASSSEGSHHHQQLPATSDSGSVGASADGQILVSKVLTYSDVSTEVARTGRIVLPRLQVQHCLPELLRLCRAEGALAALRAGGPLRLSVDLAVEDEAGRPWVLLLKTWQNVVSGEHRPTFVLENTADFVRANGLAQGDTLAFCPRGGVMVLRTSLKADQLLPRRAGAKRPAGAAGVPPAKRRPAASHLSVPTLSGQEAALGSSRKRRPVPSFPTSDPTPAAFWQPNSGNAAEAAAALLEMHHNNTGIGAAGAMESCLSAQTPTSSRDVSPAQAAGFNPYAAPAGAAPYHQHQHVSVHHPHAAAGGVDPAVAALQAWQEQQQKQLAALQAHTHVHVEPAPHGATEGIGARVPQPPTPPLGGGDAWRNGDALTTAAAAAAAQGLSLTPELLAALCQVLPSLLEKQQYEAELRRQEQERVAAALLEQYSQLYSQQQNAQPQSSNAYVQTLLAALVQQQQQAAAQQQHPLAATLHGGSHMG